MKKFMTILTAGILAVSLLVGCGSGEANPPQETEQPIQETQQPVQESGDDIIVLYTNDVHCAVDTNIGYAKLAAFRSAMEKTTPYVTLVDCGDAIQGDAIGSVSDGEYLMDIMNKTGYDLAVLGNHEFDYGMEQLSHLIDEAEATYLGCNITYSGDGENLLSAVKPYEIVSYGDTDVAYIGVSTPESLVKSTPAYFQDEEGNFVYGFSGESKEALCAKVQSYIDECREKGADRVIILSHLGTDEASEPYRSYDLISGITGVDVVLDGHSHSVIPCEYVADKEGKDVLLSSTGTQLTYIGQLVLSESGMITTTLVGAFPDSDEELALHIKEIQSEYEEKLAEIMAHTDVKLTTTDGGGMRLIRNRETNLGDFCADAYRAISGADIAFVNGGGIRADLEEGDITYGDVIAVHPYGNTLCVVEANGQEILDCLEMASRETLAKTDDGKNSVGECGGFQQVSGLRYTIDTSVPSSVQMDENGMFVSVDGPRRIKDVEVLTEDGTYVPLEAEKVYTLASHNYMLKQAGDGFNMFADNKLVIDEGMADYQILITYIQEYLGGSVGEEYTDAQDRITVK